MYFDVIRSHIISGRMWSKWPRSCCEELRMRSLTRFPIGSVSTSKTSWMNLDGYTLYMLKMSWMKASQRNLNGLGFPSGKPKGTCKISDSPWTVAILKQCPNPASSHVAGGVASRTWWCGIRADATWMFQDGSWDDPQSWILSNLPLNQWEFRDPKM